MNRKLNNKISIIKKILYKKYMNLPEYFATGEVSSLSSAFFGSGRFLKFKSLLV